jgi:hypothetical protein
MHLRTDRGIDIISAPEESRKENCTVKDRQRYRYYRNI